jgi:hypothetical protein
MSDHRRPQEIWVRNMLPGTVGKKKDKGVIRIELYGAAGFLRHARMFRPWLPPSGKGREEYLATRFRVRIGGRWMCGSTRYQLLLRSEIFEKYMQPAVQAAGVKR